jgi:hypothetical protein
MCVPAHEREREGERERVGGRISSEHLPPSLTKGVSYKNNFEKTQQSLESR